MVDGFFNGGNIVSTESPEREADISGMAAPASAGEALSSMAGTTTGAAVRFAQRHWHDDIMADTKTPEKMLSADEANKLHNMPDGHKFTAPVSEYSAKSIAEAVEKRQAAEMVWSRFANAHSAPVNMAVGMVGSMLDPIDAAAMLVPGIGEERMAYGLARAGMGEVSGTIAAKVGAGATAAMAGTAATIPLRSVTNHDELYDFTVRDALTEMVYAAPFGAMMHAGVSPLLHAGTSFLRDIKPEPYFSHGDFFSTPEPGTAAELQLAVRKGVWSAVEKTNPPSFGHVDELANMNAIDKNRWMKATVVQLGEGREPDAGKWLFPDHSAEARKIAPEAHEEWDRLQEEHDALAAEHAWGAKPTPDQLNDPAWKLEQELREHTKNILPVSWDLRVAAGEIPAEGGMAHLAETPAEHTAAPEKKTHLEDVEKDPTPAFRVTDDKGGQHSIQVKDASDDHGKAVEFTSDSAKVKLEKRPDGRWEVAWMTVDKSMRGSGLMGKIYDAIEREYGFQMRPSGLLREGGYNFWKKRNPELVKYHQQVEDYGKGWHSPRFIKEQIAELQQDLSRAKASGNASRVSDIQEDMRAWQDAWRKTPAEGKTPQAIEAMYSFGGMKAKAKPVGVAQARAMAKAGVHPESIRQETGWHKSPRGTWRFEIDDSKATLNPKYVLEGRDNSFFTGKIGDILDHPDLYKHYPDLKDIDINLSIYKGAPERGARLFPLSDHTKTVRIEVTSSNAREAKEILIHEIQHHIQGFEGEPMAEPGYSSRYAHQIKEYPNIIKDIMDDLPQYKPLLNDPANFAKLMEYVNFEIYLHNLNEIEARIAQARTHMTPEQRASTPPFTTKEILKGPQLKEGEIGRFKYPDKDMKVMQGIVSKHMGRETMELGDVADYLNSPEYKARQEAIQKEADAKRQEAESKKSQKEEAARKAKEAKEAAERKVAEAKAKEEENRKRLAKYQAAEDEARAKEIEASELERRLADLQAKKLEEDQKYAKLLDKSAAAQEKADAAAKAHEEKIADLRSAEKELSKVIEEHDIASESINIVKQMVDALGRIKAAQAERRKAALEHIKAVGMTDPAKRTAWISAMAVDSKLVAREESGHAIKASGLFNPHEWEILAGKAINDRWVDDIPEEIQSKYHETYGDRSGQEIKDAMVEEAIMHRFAKGPEAWGEPGGPVARLMARIKELLERVGNWMTSRGFQSANDVFRAMDEGKVSSRDTMPAHPARRLSDIEARMEELRPTILDAYKQAKEGALVDIPSLAAIQRAKRAYGFATAMPEGELHAALEQLYGPKEEAKMTPAKPGEIPIELQIQEQRMQAILEEGHVPTQEELAEHLQTQENLKRALLVEQGYQQAAECLITAGI